ncbi:MAG: TetR/AcrR family transcriptional regulator [Mycobacterium sp.]|nr:TetR/AcrR family transcriptional regulator [Mycobacterium sp.]
MSRSSRWTGLSRAERVAERRDLLIDAAFTLFGEGGESAVTVRSVCRHSDLHTRYFYESFTDTDELLGAAYDVVVTKLVLTLGRAMLGLPSDRARLAAGIRAALDFSSRDPRRGKILFTEARTNPVLAERRSATQEQLRESVLDTDQAVPASDRTADLVGAALYAGAIAELAQQWVSGSLGTDLDAVVDATVRVLMPADPAKVPDSPPW